MSTVVINSRVGQYHRVERPRVADRPNYAARRLAAVVTLGVAVFVSVSAVNSMVASFAGQSAQAATPASVVVAEDTPNARHVAVAGDSLWSIADRYRGDVSRDRYVDALVRLNGGTSIVVGQAVQLP